MLILDLEPGSLIPKSGKHYWALMDDGSEKFDLVVVICHSIIGSGTFFVCGGWEVPLAIDDLILIEEIHKPAGYTERSLYYYDDP